MKGIGEMLDQYRVSTRDPPFPAPSQSTHANHTKEATKKEGHEGAESRIIQDEEAPQSFVFYQPSKSSNLPFPSYVKKKKRDVKDERLFSIFKQIYINLPFLEAMIHMPKGAKVLKDLLSHTKKVKKSASSVKLSEECSAIIQRSLPQKEGDPGSFTLPCLIGPLAVKNALANLETSINLMPHSLFRRLGVSKLKPTRMSIQLADRSIKYPHRGLREFFGKEDAGDSNEVQLVSFYPRIKPVEPFEWKALENQLKPSSIKPPKLELKELHEHLEAETSFAYDPNPNSFDDSQNLSDYPPQPQYETYLCELCGNDSHYGYDCPPWFSLVYEQEPSYNQNYNDNYYPHNSSSFLCSMQSMFEEYHQREQAANLSTHTTEPSRRLNSFCYDDDDDYDYEERTIPSIVITTYPPVLPIEDPEVSLVMGNEELNTIPEKESDEFIKSSVEDLIPIPSESEDTFGSDSEYILPSCDDFSPIDIPKEKAVTFSNPLFNSNDDFISSDDESLSDEDVPEDNIEADDQAIQTILLGLPEDIYAAVDSCETAQEIWLRVQQMMKGSDIGIQEKKAKLFNEWEMFTSNEEESIESYYHHDELTEKELKQIEADDQAIQTILPGLPKDIYAVVDSCETAQEIWLRVQQMMKGSDIGIQEKKAKLFNEWERQIAQQGMNMGQDRQMQMVGGYGENQFRQYARQNVGNLNGYNAIQNIRNQKEEAGIQLQAEEFDLMAAATDLDEIKEVNANYILMANLQQASTSGTQTDKAPVYDSDGSAEVHDYENCYDNEIFNMFTQEEQYTELLEPIPEQHQVTQNDNDIIFEVTSVEQDGETVEQHPINLRKHKAAKFVGDFKSLTKEAGESLAKHKALKLEIKRLLKAVVSQDIMSVVQKESVVDTSDLQNELERMKERFENCIIKKENEYAKLWNDLYIKCDKCKYDKISYDKAYKDMQQKFKQLQAQLGDLKGKSKDTSCVLDTRNPLSQKLKNENVELEFQVLNYAKENAHLKATYKNLFDSISVSRTQTKTIIASLQNELQNTIYKNAKLRAQLFKKVSDQKDNTRDTSANSKFAKQSIVENLPKVGETHALSNPVTSNSILITQESKVMKNDKVIAPGMFRINPFKTSREEKHVPNSVRASDMTKPITVSQPPIRVRILSLQSNQLWKIFPKLVIAPGMFRISPDKISREVKKMPNTVSASSRTKPITVSQPSVITKKNVNSDLNSLSSTRLDNTKTRRPQPRSNTKNDRVPSAYKSSRSKNKEVKVEEHHRNLLLSKKNKHISSACNNSKIDSTMLYLKLFVLCVRNV
nr:hypothetical protein [Tanacetum cinerariifolium]